MRRRSSGSSAEDANDDPASPAVAVDANLASFPDWVGGRLKSKSDEFREIATSIHASREEGHNAGA